MTFLPSSGTGKRPTREFLNPSLAFTVLFTAPRLAFGAEGLLSPRLATLTAPQPEYETRSFIDPYAQDRESK